MSEQPSIRAVLETTFLSVWEDEKAGEPAPELEDDTVLLDTGLDSLSFAVFVTELEDALGYDPFAIADDAYYPQTFGEFVGFYEKYASHRAG